MGLLWFWATDGQPVMITMCANVVMGRVPT
jgi:hypothetical protein